MTWWHQFIVAMVVLWPWLQYEHGATNHSHYSHYSHYNHYNHYSTITMSMRRIDVTQGVELQLQLQPRPIVTPSVPAGAPRVWYALTNNGWEESAGCSTFTVRGSGRPTVLLTGVSPYFRSRLLLPRRG